MKVCEYCGTNAEDYVLQCPNCGSASISEKQNIFIYTYTNTETNVDTETNEIVIT